MKVAPDLDFTDAFSIPLSDTVMILQTDLANGKWYWKVSSSKNLNIFPPVDSLVIAVTSVAHKENQHGAHNIRFVRMPNICRVHFHGVQAKHAHAVVYDISGRNVAEFSLLQSEKTTMVWDYTDRNGRPVPSGIYIVSIRAQKKVFSQVVNISR